MIYKAKIEKGILGLLLMFPVIATFVTKIFSKINLSSSFILLLIFYLFAFFIIFLISSTKYILEDDRLVISRLGIKSCITYNNIDDVMLEGNKFLSLEAPAFSQVCLIKNGIIIMRLSPNNPKDFISQINYKIN